MDIQELTEHIKGQAGLIVENMPEVLPALFVVSGSQVSIVGLEMTEQLKGHRQVLLPNLLRQLNADAYVMVAEAWCARLDKDSPLVKRITEGEIKVSQLPLDDKSEIVQIIAVENGKPAQCWFADIKCKADQRFIAGWVKMPENGSLGGRLVITEW